MFYFRFPNISRHFSNFSISSCSNRASTQPLKNSVPKHFALEKEIIGKELNVAPNLYRFYQKGCEKSVAKFPKKIRSRKKLTQKLYTPSKRYFEVGQSVWHISVRKKFFNLFHTHERQVWNQSFKTWTHQQKLWLLTLNKSFWKSFKSFQFHST